MHLVNQTMIVMECCWQVRALDRLEAILSEKEWLVGGEFSAADVAVGAYLLYVPQVRLRVNEPACPPH